MPVEAKTTPILDLGDEEALPGQKRDYRLMCKYGKDCYQKNPMHHQKFRHPKEGEDEMDTKEKPEKEEEEVGEEAVIEQVPVVKKVKTDDEEMETREEAAMAEEEPSKKEEEVEVEASEILPPVEDWPKDPVKNVEQKFLTKMPADFMAFWQFCKGINRENPREAILKSCGLRLVGPYDIVAGQTFETRKLNDFLCHYRYYRDPPEFQTLLVSADEEVGSDFHVGYFRDDPKVNPVFVAAFNANGMDDHKFVLMGDNLFGALYNHVTKLVAKADPFKQTALQKLKETIHFHATMKNQDDTFLLEPKTQSMKNRDRKKVATTFHGAGMVVPYNKETQVGYREIPESNADLKKMLTKVVETHVSGDDDAKNKAFDALQELVTNVQFANDEGDPGMGLELGLDAFLHGGDCLQSTVKHLLTVAYDLLDREPFAKIAVAHLHRRKEGQKVFKAQ